MSKELALVLLPEEAADEQIVKKVVQRLLRVEAEEIEHIALLKQSIDARRDPVKINLRVEAFLKGEKYIPKNYLPARKDVSDMEPVAIIGAGPAGLFAALECIAQNKKPLVFERGKNVRDRRRDLAKLNKEHLVNEESNYCYGEGGAGTYSDGKLYTRSKKRGDVRAVLETLVGHGASDQILSHAHPHIGTNKLPQIIINIREYIINCGGEVNFEHKLTDLIVENNKIKGAVFNNEININSKNLILATGHSARDIFELLHQKNINIEAKPFAIGVRVEHPQDLIDKIQYHCETKSEFLPPAAYALVQQVQGRGVYSFCMCPGGIVAPCATTPGEIVTNGWSPSKRNNPFANSGIVVTVEPEDWKKYKDLGPLAPLALQKEIEQTCWKAAGNEENSTNKGQLAPAQRMIDFVEGKTSTSLPDCSYVPGIVSAPLHEILPDFISKRLKEAFKAYGKKMKGYYTNDAVLVAPESRTSSPVRIPREKDTGQHPDIEGLYPVGEGAGYAGGIVSAAVDGIIATRKIVERMAD